MVPLGYAQSRKRHQLEGELQEGGQKNQNSSYKINKYTRDVKYMMSIANTAE